MIYGQRWGEGERGIRLPLTHTIISQLSFLSTLFPPCEIDSVPLSKQTPGDRGRGGGTDFKRSSGGSTNTWGLTQFSPPGSRGQVGGRKEGGLGFSFSITTITAQRDRRVGFPRCSVGLWSQELGRLLGRSVGGWTPLCPSGCSLSATALSPRSTFSLPLLRGRMHFAHALSSHISIPPFCPLLPSIHSHCRPSSSYGGEEGGLPGSWGGEQIGFPPHLQQPFASPLPLFPERPQPIPALLPLSCMRSFALPSKRGGNEEGLPPSKAGLIEERVGEATNQPFPPFAFLQALREGASEDRASSLAQALSLSILSSDPALSPRQRPPPPPPRRVLRRRSPTPTSKRKRKVFSSLPLLRPPPSLHYVRRTVKTSLLSPRRDWK